MTEIAFFLTEFFWTDLYLYPVFSEFWVDVPNTMDVENSVARIIHELDSGEL